MLPRPWKLLALVAVVVGISCGGGEPGTATQPGDATASVQVTPGTVALITGNAQQLTAVALDATGAVRAGRSVAWSSSAPAVASVNGSGTVVALAPGNALITATIDSRSAGVVVTVTDPPAAPVATVRLTPNTVSLPVGDVQALSVTTLDAASRVLTDRPVSWISDAPAVAHVSASGLVTAVGVGVASITASSEGRTATATISVRALGPVSSITLTPTLATVDIGSSMGVIATLRDATGALLTNRLIEWTSTDPAIAPVSGTGVVSGLTAGKATITATSEGKSAVTVVTVRAP